MVSEKDLKKILDSGVTDYIYNSETDRYERIVSVIDEDGDEHEIINHITIDEEFGGVRFVDETTLTITAYGLNELWINQDEDGRDVLTIRI